MHCVSMLLQLGVWWEDTKRTLRGGYERLEGGHHSTAA